MELVFKVYVSHQIFRSDIDLQKSKMQKISPKEIQELKSQMKS